MDALEIGVKLCWVEGNMKEGENAFHSQSFRTVRRFPNPTERCMVVLRLRFTLRGVRRENCAEVKYLPVNRTK